MFSGPLCAKHLQVNCSSFIGPPVFLVAVAQVEVLPSPNISPVDPIQGNHMNLSYEAIGAKWIDGESRAKKVCNGSVDISCYSSDAGSRRQVAGARYEINESKIFSEPEKKPWEIAA